MARYVLTRLSTIALILGLTILSTGCGTSSASPPPTGQHSNHTHHLHQGHSYHFTMENILVGNQIGVVVAPHGNMATEFVDPHITHTRSEQFIVTFKNMSPGKFKTNKWITLKNNRIATSMKLTKEGYDLRMTLSLKSNIHSFQPSGAGGFVIGFIFK